MAHRGAALRDLTNAEPIWFAGPDRCNKPACLIGSIPGWVVGKQEVIRLFPDSPSYSLRASAVGLAQLTFRLDRDPGKTPTHTRRSLSRAHLLG
jgi:hypothetical protein